jgi:hypothetical protein
LRAVFDAVDNFLSRCRVGIGGGGDNGQAVGNEEYRNYDRGFLVLEAVLVV